MIHKHLDDMSTHGRRENARGLHGKHVVRSQGEPAVPYWDSNPVKGADAVRAPCSRRHTCSALHPSASVSTCGQYSSSNSSLIWCHPSPCHPVYPKRSRAGVTTPTCVTEAMARFPQPCVMVDICTIDRPLPPMAAAGGRMSFPLPRGQTAIQVID